MKYYMYFLINIFFIINIDCFSQDTINENYFSELRDKLIVIVI